MCVPVYDTPLTIDQVLAALEEQPKAIAAEGVVLLRRLFALDDPWLKHGKPSSVSRMTMPGNSL
jgi:hypothetical protein